MTDDWPDRRLDDLAQQVQLMATAVTHIARHAVKLDNIEDDIRESKEARREDVARFQAALQAIAETCESNTRRVEAKIDARAAGKWTFWAAILGPTLTALIGAAALILTGGPS